jgi:hypothetical protein
MALYILATALGSNLNMIHTAAVENSGVRMGMRMMIRTRETKRFPLDNSFFKQKGTNSLFSSLMYDDDSAARSKEIYGY